MRRLGARIGKAIMKYWHKFVTFMNMVPREGAEMRDLAVFIRSLSLIYLFYFIISSIPLFATTYYVAAIFECLCAGLFLISFIFTFRGKTNFAMDFFGAVIVAAPTVLTLVTGWKTNFQWSLIVEILVLYFTLEINKNVKKQLFRVISATFIIIAFITHVFPNNLDFSLFWGICFHVISAIFYASVIHVIAFFYSNKFNAAEENLRDVNNRLREMASTDALTSLPNRRVMNEHLTLLAYTYELSNDPFVIAIADIDFFKKINDTYGHEAGDHVLQGVAAIFRETMKGKGMVARWGGEEFLFVFENVTGAQAKAVLEGMRDRIEKTPFVFGEDTIHITLTLGVEDYSLVNGVEVTVSKADDKLYQGKMTGRNKVVY